MMKNVRRRIPLFALSLSCAVLAIVSLAAQQAPAQAPQPQQPTFRLPINFVRVDVIVDDKRGNPVPGLGAADFVVTEDGKPQKIESLKYIHVGSATEQQLAATEPPREIRSEGDEEAEAAREDTRIFAIFLDDYHVRLSNSMAVRQAIAKFVATQLGPNDLVEIMYPLTPVSGLLLTRDHEKVARALETFTGRKYDYRPLNQIEEQYQNYPAQTIEEIRNQVSLSAVKGLVTHLGGLSEKRKSVILVSEGFTSLLPPQLRDPIASMPGVGNPMRTDPNAGDNPAEQRANFFAGAGMLSDLHSVFDAANKANTAIYALDPRGLGTGEFDMSQPNISQRTDDRIFQSSLDSLRVLAGNTDGYAIVDRNDLANGLGKILHDSSAYYLLGYNSTLTAADGKFHAIKVKVNRPGVDVRARKGYWAPTEEDRARAMAPPKPAAPAAVTRALSAIVAPPHGGLLETWIGASRGENGRTRVTFVCEPSPAAAGGDPSAPQPARVSLVAASPKGESYFRGEIVGGLTRTSATPAAAQAPGRLVFDVPPGRLQLRVAVEGPNAQVIDTDVSEVDIPDLTAPQVMLTTPAVYPARTAREFRTMAADANAAPTANRQFSRTQRLLIRFGAYGPGNTTPAVTVNLLGRNGQPISKLATQPAPSSPQDLAVDLPLAGLAAGEYVIEIKAKGESGEATQMVAIRVTA